VSDNFAYKDFATDFAWLIVFVLYIILFPFRARVNYDF
jgi:hypothetical protein